MFINTHQRQRFTGSSRTTGTPDTVDIIFRYVWQFIVDDVRQLFDIQTARSDIGRHQYANVTRFKISQRTGTRTLRFIPVDRRTTDAIFIELLSQMVSAVFGTGKHQHLLPVPFTNHVRQQFAFAFLINKVNVLGHLIRRGIAACHFDFQRVVQQFFRQGFNIVREGRREQQVLALRWQFC